MHVRRANGSRSSFRASKSAKAETRPGRRTALCYLEVQCTWFVIMRFPIRKLELVSKFPHRDARHARVLYSCGYTAVLACSRAELTKCAPTGIRNRVLRLEGEDDNHYTMGAGIHHDCWLEAADLVLTCCDPPLYTHPPLPYRNIHSARRAARWATPWARRLRRRLRRPRRLRPPTSRRLRRVPPRRGRPLRAPSPPCLLASARCCAACSRAATWRCTRPCAVATWPRCRRCWRVGGASA